MITPLAAQNRVVLEQNSQVLQRANAGPVPGQPQRTSPAGLADSIMSDGGLGFLRARIEEKLHDTFAPAGEHGVPDATKGTVASYESAADLSPEATADRIVGFALSLRNAFSRQHPDLTPEELTARFEVEIRRGIEAGFGKARSILGDLDLLDETVATNVEATWAAVQQKLADSF